MIFATFHLDHWYRIFFDNHFDKEEYQNWIVMVKGLGFDTIVIDNLIAEYTIDIILKNDLNIIFSPSYTKSINEKEDKIYEVEYIRDINSRLDEISYKNIINYTIDSILQFKNVYLRFNSNINEVYYNIHLGAYLEAMFPIHIFNKSSILEGVWTQEHQRYIDLFKEIVIIAKKFGFEKFIYASQIIGHGIHEKQFELDGTTICHEIINLGIDPQNFIYYTPTIFAHDGTYFVNNMIQQTGLKKVFNIKTMHGAQGINGFPITSTISFFNQVDGIWMSTGEKCFSKNRLTQIDFNTAKPEKISLIKRTISSIKNNNREDILFISRLLSKQASKKPQFGEPIYDEHFSLDGLPQC